MVNLIPQDTKIDFVGFRKITLTISGLIVLGSILLMLIKGLNFGIDFRGGFLIEIRTEKEADLNTMRSTLSGLGLGDVKLQNTDSPHDVMIRLEQQPGGDAAQGVALKKVKEALGEGVTYRRIDSVGPTFSEDLAYNGMIAFTLALLAMLIYIWLRFEWQFGLCAVIALLHDGLSVFGFYSFSGFEFNETVIIAVLTTIGYSINDTVVVYDRIRENLRKYKKASQTEIINRSINETLSRTVLTSGSTLLALIALYWVGGTVIENFTLPIIVGVGIGTYSSICLASILLLFFDVRTAVESSAPENTSGDKVVV